MAYRNEIDAAIHRVLDSGWYVLGEEVRAFENEFAEFLGVNHAVGVASGTDALRVALVALGIGPGDEVITVSHTAVATVAAIELAGATPVFVDIDADTHTISPPGLPRAVTQRTKAVLPVHLYGRPVELTAVMEFADAYGLVVIEDCAQAHGAIYDGRRVGTFGRMNCFSFYPTKNLGALGDGGIVVTDDSQLAESARRLREYGWDQRRVSETAGWNSRLDEIQAAVLRVKLRHLDDDNAKRSSWADKYREALADCGLVLPKVETDGNGPFRDHVFHQFVVRSDRRDDLQLHLKEHGIHTLVHYPVPAHMQPAYRHFNRDDQHLPETERAAREVLSLPVYPELSESDLNQVIKAIRDFQ